MEKTPLQLIRQFTQGLGFKLSFYAGLVMFLALLAFSHFSIKAQEKSLIDKMIKNTFKDSEVIKAAIWNGMMTKDREVIRGIIRAIGDHGSIEQIHLVDHEGVLHYTSGDEDLSGSKPITGGPLMADIATDTSLRHRITDGGKAIQVVNPILNTPSCSTAACHAHPKTEHVLGAISLKVPLAPVHEEISRNTHRTVIFAALLFIFISTIIGLAVIFLVTPNLRRLQRMAGQLARGDADAPETPLLSGSDELAELSRSFDEMGRIVRERTARLTEGRRLYKSLFELVPCYLTVVSRDYHIVRANQAFLDHFGPQVGKPCYVGYKGRSERCEDCPVEKTFATGQPHESEESWRLGAGEAAVIVRTAPIVDEGGRTVEVLEMSLDVTEIKRLQADLMRRQAEYKRLFENVPCYLTVVDRDFTIVQANEVFAREFGGKTGEKCYWAYKGRDSRCDNCLVEKTFEDGQSRTSEEVWQHNGTTTNVVVNTAPIVDDNGSIVAVMEMSANITEVKRLQSELALLGETIAGMSHSIKNIVAGLQGGVYLVDSGLQRGRDDRVRDGWDMVKRNIDKVSDLVKGILYASKEREPEYRPCDCGELLTEVCDLFEERARNDGIELRRDFVPRMGSGMLDAAGLHTALANLVANAIEACRAREDGGTQVVVGGSVNEGLLRLSVSDDGGGIPEEVRNRLFHKFFSTKGSKGTGLGLVLTRKVIQEHGGSITVDAQAGHGTTFLIEMPFTRAEQDALLPDTQEGLHEDEQREPAQH